VLFVGDRAHATGEANLPKDTSGYLVGSAYGSRDLGSEIAECESTTLSPISPGRFLEAPYVPETDPVLKLRLMQSAAPSFEGCPGQAAASFYLSGTLWEGRHTYDSQFSFPREAIGMGKVVQLITLPVRGRICPNNIHAGMDVCLLDVEAKVTFTKVDEWVADDGTPADPLPPAPPVDPRAEAISNAVAQYGKDLAPSDPRADAISNAVAQYGKEPPRDPRAEIISNAVRQYGRKLELRVGCSGGCRGTAVVSTGGAAPRSGAPPARKVVGRVTFRVAAGKPRRVRLTLPAKARRALARAGRAWVTVTLEPKNGPKAARTLELRRGRARTA
jgi:hypothetical protein